MEIFVSIAMPVAVNDFTLRRFYQGVVEQFFDDERVMIIFSRLIDLFCHWVSPLSMMNDIEASTIFFFKEP
jgi:hypothetical protein